MEVFLRRRGRMKKIALFLAVLLSIWGCATFSENYKLGTKAAMNKDWNEAVKYYEKALWESPDNSVYRLALFRAKMAASYSHLLKARELVAQGMKEEALLEYEKALSYDPLNRVIAKEVALLKGEEVKEEEPEEKKIELPVKLRVDKEKVQLEFTKVNLRSIFQALAKFAKVNIIFDEQFKDISFSISLKDVDFEGAIRTLCLASKNFYRIIDEKTIIIAPDQPLKRAQYELNAIRTFYLSNINAQEVQQLLAQMLRTQLGRVPTIFVDKNLNSVTVRDTPSNIELAEKLLKIWDKSKGEVVIDLEIMEVTRTRLRELGLDFDQHIIGFKYGESDAAEDSGWISLRDLDFSKRENYQISLPLAFIKFLESDSDTKIIAQPRLRGMQDEEIRYLVGEKVPIPRTTFTPIAAGGVSQQPITSFEYQDVGIELAVKPKIHFENEVTLEIEIKITSLGGVGYADIPIISTREVKNVIRLKNGETNFLAGLLKDEERMSLKGIPGLKNIPLLGSLFSSTQQTITQTDVILTLTPYIIRTLPLDEKDIEPLWIGLDKVAPLSREPQPMPEDVLEQRRAQERRLEEERRREEAEQDQVFLNPSNLQIPQDREFRINANMRTQQEIGMLSLTVNYDAQMFNLKEIVAGGLIRRLGDDVPFLKNIDNTAGIATIGFSSPEIDRGLKGAGRIASLLFQTVRKGEGTISITSVTANKPSGEAVSFGYNECRIVVR
jgi:general secretion pathway protein D